MKPILVLQHLPDDGPAFLATWLAGQGLTMDLRCDAGDYPVDTSGHAALAVLGGEMSANADLPALRQGEALILDAMARDVPVIGHCLGGQLMAKALGESIGASVQPEIGWHAVDWQPQAAAWFGDEVLAPDAPAMFEWHSEAFSVPPGAIRLGGNAACANQAFSIGPHLAMQFHIELDRAKLDRWTVDHDATRHALAGAAGQIQTREAMYARIDRRLAAQQRLAAHAYRHWMAAASASQADG